MLKTSLISLISLISFCHYDLFFCYDMLQKSFNLICKYIKVKRF